MTRNELLDRYRHLRGVNRQINDAVMKLVPGAVMMEFGKRIGLLRGRTFVLDSEDDLALVCDLAVYIGKDGRSSALDRFARTARFVPGSDEALILSAMQESWFTVFEIECRHEIGGPVIRDVMREETFQFLDIGYEMTAKDGDRFGGRLLAVEGFVMTSGPALPFDFEMGQAVAEAVKHWHPGTARESRLAIEVYRAAIKTGAMQRLQFRSVGGEDDETSEAA